MVRNSTIGILSAVRAAFDNLKGARRSVVDGDDDFRQVLANDRQLNGGKRDNREPSPGKVTISCWPKSFRNA